MLHGKRWFTHEDWHKASFARRAGMIVSFGSLALLCMSAVALVFGFGVKLLWNAILPDIAHVGPITYWQAVGLLILSRLLVGGFHRGGGGPRHRGHCHHRHHDDALDDFVERGPRPTAKPADAE